MNIFATVSSTKHQKNVITAPCWSKRRWISLSGLFYTLSQQIYDTNISEGIYMKPMYTLPNWVKSESYSLLCFKIS